MLWLPERIGVPISCERIHRIVHLISHACVDSNRADRVEQHAVSSAAYVEWGRSVQPICAGTVVIHPEAENRASPVASRHLKPEAIKLLIRRQWQAYSRFAIRIAA